VVGVRLSATLNERWNVVLEGLKPIPRVVKCKVGQLLETLEPSDQEILQAALADTKKWSSHGLKNALMERGITIGDVVIGKHRRGLCVCRVG